MKYGVLFMSALGFLSSCFGGGIVGSNYEQKLPTLTLEDYFQGPISVWGIIQDRSGNVISRFDAHIDGNWEGNKGVLEEEFTYYDSGEKQQRRWEITKIDDTNYTATAGDIIGTATGKRYGNALYWSYKMDVPVDGSTYRLTFDDWMWAMNNDVVINRSYLKKFGITFAEITIFMQKK